MKKVVYVALVLFLALTMAGGACAEVIIKVANSGPANEGNRTVKAIKVFKHLVEKGTNGEVVVQAYHASALGSEREAMEGIKMGSIEMGTLSSGPMPGFFPWSMAFDIPYLFSSAPVAWETFNGEFGREFSNAFKEKTGVRILTVAEIGYRHFTNNKRPLDSPASLKGLKIRTMENPAHMQMAKSFGADPTPIAFGELYMALQQKVVDGMECPVALIHDMKFYEVQDQMVLDGHLYTPIFVLINERFFQKKLTPAQQKVVMDAAKVFATVHNGFNQQADIEGLKKLKAKGMNVIIPSDDFVAQLRNISQPSVLAYLKEKIGEEKVEKVLKAVSDTEKIIGSRSEQIVKETIQKANEIYDGIKK